MNGYGNDDGMETEEKQKPFPSLPTPPWKARKHRELPTFPQLRLRLGFLFSPSSFNFNFDESVTYLPGTSCYPHPRPLNKTEFFRSLQSRALRSTV